ncbi:uncharacterized protein LOC128229963 [Mya arenaria]|uniref:uncharacterized protein LOC128229963 n=1 Tax=Mya arenaria TaxID=6604 RepID=UPI0022E0AD1E|nr:uncharacterized protein LOC128229963 [Mya arenaria]
MERSAAEYLVYLRENVSDLKQEAKDMGLTEEEIKFCIDKALSLDSNQNELINSPKNIARKCFHYFRVLLKIWILACLLLIAAICGGLFLIETHKPSADFVSRTLQPYGYAIFRSLRLSTLPVHRWMNITEYYNAECIVDNPYYVEEFNYECKVCENFKNLKVMNATDFTEERFKAFAHAFKPVHLKGVQDRNVDYQDLRNTYKLNREVLLESLYKVTSLDVHIRSLGDIFESDLGEQVNTSSSIRIDWFSQSVTASVVLRGLFPRPKVVPEKHEIPLEKHVFILGPNSPTFELPLTMHPIQLYIQGSGQRRLLARPHKNCRDSCNTLLAFMEPGDALMLQNDVWDGWVATGDGPSIGYLISIGI